MEIVSKTKHEPLDVLHAQAFGQHMPEMSMTILKLRY